MSAQPHIEIDQGLPSHLTKLTQVPVLTQLQEEALTKKVQEGDVQARRRLVEANMRLVIKIATGYRNGSIPLEDLIQEGAIGLMAAAERFDPKRGFRFSTYATFWIKQTISRALDSKSRSIRLPSQVACAVRKVERERAKLAATLGKEPTHEELASAMGLSPNRLLALIQYSGELLSLDATMGEGGGPSLGSLLEGLEQGNPETHVLSRQNVEELQRVMLELNEREQRVMRLRFRLDGGVSYLHEEVAVELCISRERVRQIEAQAIKKLRAIAEQRRLREVFDA